MTEQDKPKPRRGAFAPGNTAHQKHGGAAAVMAIVQGEPFRGLAAKTEAEVVADLETEGIVGMIESGARRLETAARLYWDAFQRACDRAIAGDVAAIKELDHYAARFGWLQGKAGSQWKAALEVRKHQDPKALDYDELVKELKKDAKP